jgi:hypothetical protein
MTQELIIKNGKEPGAPKNSEFTSNAEQNFMLSPIINVDGTQIVLDNVLWENAKSIGDAALIQNVSKDCLSPELLKAANAVGLAYAISKLEKKL